MSDARPRPGVALRVPGSLAGMEDLSCFVLARLADDERRFQAGELPHIDEAERRGRLRIMRTDDQRAYCWLLGQLRRGKNVCPSYFRKKPHPPGRSSSPA
jgi:hypothetical protein